MTVITIQVKMPGKNDAIRVEVDTNDTVAVAKEKLSGPCDTPADRQRLIFCGRVLKDNQVLSECSTYILHPLSPIVTSSIFYLLLVKRCRSSCCAPVLDLYTPSPANSPSLPFPWFLASPSSL